MGQLYKRQISRLYVHICIYIYVVMSFLDPVAGLLDLLGATGVYQGSVSVGSSWWPLINHQPHNSRSLLATGLGYWLLFLEVYGQKVSSDVLCQGPDIERYLLWIIVHDTRTVKFRVGCSGFSRSFGVHRVSPLKAVVRGPWAFDLHGRHLLRTTPLREPASRKSLQDAWGTSRHAEPGIWILVMRTDQGAISNFSALSVPRLARADPRLINRLLAMVLCGRRPHIRIVRSGTLSFEGVQRFWGSRVCGAI